MELNKAQFEAVTTAPNSVLQILAGPGFGKTKVLTYRVCFLLEQGLKPENIILTTFTNKAANEMKERIGKLCQNGVESKLITGTFHSICRRYLVKYGSFIELRKGWGIADIDDTKSILKQILKDSVGNIGINAALNKISSLKSSGITWEEFHAQQAAIQYNRQNPDDMTMSLEMAQVYQEYENKLDSMNLLDFDDLLLRTRRLLLRHPHCISNIQHVLVDEFQDTNLVQYQLMRLFAQSCSAISIVGDPDQGIYGWRSAHAGNVKQMRSDYSNVLVVNLEQNYRSSSWILKCSRTVIEQDSSRIAKTLVGTKGRGVQPVMRILADAYVEGKWIAREIRRVMGLTGGMIRERDIAILVRSSSMTRTLEGALAAVGLRYRMVGGRKFFDREEIRDLLAYLKVIDSPDDQMAIQRILNVPNRRLGEQRLSHFIKDSESNSRSIWDSIEAFLRGETRFPINDKQAEDNLATFIRTIKLARTSLAAGQIASVAELIDFVREKVKYDGHLRKKFGAEADDRIANLEELKTFANEIAKVTNENELPDIGLGGTREESPLERFMGNITLMTDVQDGEDSKFDNITISTIHAAKGLEWPVVFVPGVYQGCIPHSRCEDTDEERRLLYVSMTRAKSLLYLSRPQINPRGDPLKPSVFLENMKIHELLAPRGSTIDAASIAAVLGRTPPTEEHIENMCKTLPSLHDEDWVENPRNTLGRSQSFGNNSSSQSQQWGSQTTTSSLTTTTQIGTTTFTRNPSFTGPGDLPKNNLMINVPPGASMGFISSRQVLSMLPPEHLTNSVPQPQLKRKSEDLPAGFQPSSDAVVNSQPGPPAKKPTLSGAIVDRARPIANGPVLPLLQSSSPHPGVDVDALPYQSFTSPIGLTTQQTAPPAGRANHTPVTRPKCDCGKPAEEKACQGRAKPENTGRLLYVCAGTRGKTKCSYFQWKDETGPICICGVPAKEEVCRGLSKPENKGRLMITCGGAKGTKKCGYFQWKDEISQRPEESSDDEDDEFMPLPAKSNNGSGYLLDELPTITSPLAPVKPGPKRKTKKPSAAPARRGRGGGSGWGRGGRSTYWGGRRSYSYSLPPW